MATSPELTGGAGSTYEAQVAAFFLAELLVGAEVRGLDGPLSLRVAVQRKALGAPLDDIVVVGSRHDARHATLQLQAKRSLRISSALSNLDFRAVVHATWDAINANSFQQGIDRAGAVTEYMSSGESYRAVRMLTQAARNAYDGNELRKRLDAGIYGIAKQPAAVVAKILQEKLDRPPSDDEMWRFLRHFIVLHLELSGDGARDRHSSIEQLRASLPPSEKVRARDLFDTLEVAAREMCATAGNVDRATIAARLAGRYSLDEQALHGGEPETILAREAASNDLSNFQRTVPPSSLVELDLEWEEEDKRLSTNQISIVAALYRSQNFILQAEPGAGKSTALLQIASVVLTETVDRVPVILPLPELASSRRSVFEEIAARASFGKVPIAHLRRVAEMGRFVLLFDGWNELSIEQRSVVRQELQKYFRDFANTAFVLATRPLTPFPGFRACRLFLGFLTHEQQRALLTADLGHSGSSLLDQARRVPGLRTVLRIPLYLRALASIGGQGVLPTTKEQVLRRFVAEQETHPAHRDLIAHKLRGTHTAYLEAIAVELTVLETIAIGESALRHVITKVADRLVSEGQIPTRPDQLEVIDLLVAHHILVEREDTSARLFSFQHQQFQEWFASFHVERSIIAAENTVNNDARERLDAILNHPTWEEPLLFAIERLIQKGSYARGVARTVLRALGIDPMLAAAMIQRLPTEVWNLVSEHVLQFAHAWQEGTNSSRVLDFVLRTERPEFAEQIWKAIEAPDTPNQNEGVLSHGISPSSLGPNWRNRFASLTPVRQRKVLWDVMADGHPEGIDFAVQAIQIAPAHEVLLSVLESLDFYGAEAEYADLLRKASKEVWQHLAGRERVSDIPAEFRQCLVAEKRTLMRSLPVGVKRITLLMELDEEGELDDADTLVQEIFETTFEEYHLARSTYQRLANRHPEKLSARLLQRLLSGMPIAFAAGDHIRPSDATDQDAVRALAIDPSVEERRRALAARLLDTQSAQIILNELLQAFQELATTEYPAAEAIRSRYSILSDALTAVPLGSLASAVLAVNPTHPRAVAALSERLFRWRGDDHQEDTIPLPEDARLALRQRIEEWVLQIQFHPELRRHDLAEVASAIRRIRTPELLPLLKILLDLDLALWRKQRAERAAASRKQVPHNSEAHMSYENIYRGAFESFAGEATRAILLGYLHDPDFAAEAAIALIPYGKESFVDPKTELRHGPHYELIASAKAAKSNQDLQKAAHPVAVVVLNRVDTLLTLGDAASISLAVRLATAAANMDYGERTATLVAVVKANGSMSARYGLLLSMLLAGEEIESAWVEAGLAEALSRISAKFWRPEDVWWDISRWLQLLAFTDKASELKPRIAALPQQLRVRYRIRDVARVLVHAEPTAALEVLAFLYESVPANLEPYEAIAFIAQLGSESAAAYLLDVAFQDEKINSLERDWYYVQQYFGPLVNKYVAVKNAMFDRLRGEHTALYRKTVASILPEIIRQDDVPPILDIVKGVSDPLRDALINGMSNVSLARRYIDGYPGTYEEEPIDISGLRRKLFQAAIGSGEKAQFARTLLSRADAVRDYSGRPLSEPRHPDIVSNQPWPFEARQAWSASS